MAGIRSDLVFTPQIWSSMRRSGLWSTLMLGPENCLPHPVLLNCNSQDLNLLDHWAHKWVTHICNKQQQHYAKTRGIMYLTVSKTFERRHTERQSHALIAWKSTVCEGSTYTVMLSLLLPHQASLPLNAQMQKFCKFKKKNFKTLFIYLLWIA